MNKSVIAVAIACAFTSAAYAQSSTVTIYGLVDVGLLRLDPRAGTVSEVPGSTAIESGIRSGSRLGFRGIEDLGGGLSAVMQLESGFSTDTGASGQGGRLFGRQAYAGLSSTSFGTVVMGRLATFSSGTGAFDMYGDIDPFGTSYGVTGNLGNTQSSANSLRLDNAALWRSPDWGGFKVGAGYSFRAAGAENAGSSNNNRVAFFGASYSAGPIYLALTYDILELGEVAGAPKQKNLQVGGTYDLKFMKLHAAYAKEDNVYPNVVASTAQQAPGSDADAWVVGVSAPFGPHKLLASYQKRDVDSLGAIPEGDRDIWALGYEYRFSRRTMLYATYGDRKDDGSLRTATSGGLKALGAGLMHTF